MSVTTKSTLGRKYDPAPENTEHISLKSKYDHFINGKFVPSTENKYARTINPATEKILARVAVGSSKDINKAVKAAENAYKKTWSRISGSDRSKYIFRIARIIQEKARELAIIESLDGGKPIRESRDLDVPLAAAHFFYYAGWADKLNYAFPGQKVSSLGVAGQIIPWNFPLLMAAWKIAPALATGNTVVLKPAETTPLTALKLAEIIQEAGLPDGVVNIVAGGPEAGEALVQHKGINKIAFTGSTAVGKKIQSFAAGKDLKYTLELGGKGANIIFEDAAIDQAVEGIIDAIFFNQGHVCCAGSRLFVHEAVHEEVIRKLNHRISTLIIGDPLDKNTDIGAINSRAQLRRIENYFKVGLKEGASCYQPEVELPEKGFWFKPTLFWDVSQSNRIVQEEIFGPVLTIQTFRTTSEVMEKANNSPYGLSGGIWTDKGSKLFHASSKLKAGVVWGNTFNRFDPSSPFGGYKESGIGREGGLHGLKPYVSISGKI